MPLDFSRAFQLAEAQVADQKEESLKRQVKMMKQHLDRINTNLTAHKDRKKEEAMSKLFKEEKVDFEAYAARNGASRAGYGDAGTHMTSRHVSGASKKRTMARLAKSGEELSQKRDTLRKEYNSKIASGVLQEPTSMDTLKKAASGHPDNKSTQAAKNVLTKRQARMIQKEEVIMERNDKILGRYRIIHTKTGEVMGSHDDRTQALAMGKKCGGFPHVRMEDSEKAS